ncbi:hypothetical protein CONLIGDRAFT_717590 [Coniochaeta ligniaria NRRL 30616]|uniref:Azaphilone pigments biosynthesis cluster protein L N-terminal domain-containing protein n=1 Tax=Coniochaeta ligniaria NRRL 30616 TaxID=1408157 RepID=A0A1J7J809_9PEZI|nr:hypothetical protein CONLIGDRAFT_717590 [Coniochaeta ligniaria NRRL 30616]
MEALGVGASVLAFVIVGLQSAKTIHDILASVKDGSETVDRAEADIMSLQSTLERLASCRIIAERPDEALAAKVKSCADDMTRYAEKLKKLVTDDGSGLSRQWRKIKVFLNEKDLAKISAVVVGHTAGLNLHLNVLDSDTLFEVKDDLGAVRRELSVQQTIRESQSTIIAQQTTVTQTVRDTMTHITNETRNIHNETQNMHETVRAAMGGSRAERDQESGTRVVEEVDDSGGIVGEVPGKELQAAEWGVGSLPALTLLPRPISSPPSPRLRTADDDALAEELLKRRRLNAGQDNSQLGLDRAFTTNKKKSWDPKEIYDALDAYVGNTGSPGIAEALVFKLISTGASLSRFRRAQVYLIRCGADVFALDDSGRNVSEVACKAWYNSITEDLWDVVLADCDYDIAQFRHRPRRARYADYYTRKMFEELWKGQEHLCPYYYDEVTPTTNEEQGRRVWDDSGSSSDEEDGGGCVLGEP